jgi:hypothetical protein
MIRRYILLPPCTRLEPSAAPNIRTPLPSFSAYAAVLHDAILSRPEKGSAEVLNRRLRTGVDSIRREVIERWLLPQQSSNPGTIGAANEPVIRRSGAPLTANFSSGNVPTQSTSGSSPKKQSAAGRKGYLTVRICLLDFLSICLALS